MEDRLIGNFLNRLNSRFWRISGSRLFMKLVAASPKTIKYLSLSKIAKTVFGKSEILCKNEGCKAQFPWLLQSRKSTNRSALRILSYSWSDKTWPSAAIITRNPLIASKIGGRDNLLENCISSKIIKYIRNWGFQQVHHQKPSLNREFYELRDAYFFGTSFLQYPFCDSWFKSIALGVFAWFDDSLSPGKFSTTDFAWV